MSRRMKVDMTNVESYTRCPEGQFPAKLVKLEECTIQGSGDDGLKAKFEVTGGSGKGSNVFETFSLGEKALWKLKMMLEAMGMKATGKMTLDLDKLEGKSVGIEVVHDEFNGRKTAKIAQYLKLSELEDTEADEDDEDEDDDDEDEEPVKKPAKKAPAKKSKKQPEPDEDEDEDDDDDEDEDEEKSAPKKSSKKAPAKAAKKSSKKAKPEPEDDDEDDWEDDED
jgi:hypothetical protein